MKYAVLFPALALQFVMVGFAVSHFADNIIKQNSTMIGFWFAIVLANLVFMVPTMKLLYWHKGE